MFADFQDKIFIVKNIFFCTNISKTRNKEIKTRNIYCITKIWHDPEKGGLLHMEQNLYNQKYYNTNYPGFGSETKYKNMSIEELRQIKVISNTDGRPPKGLTNDKWQAEFNIRKLFIHPYGSETTKLGGKYSREAGTWNTGPGKPYVGCTNWQSYCSFINDILKNIRNGQIDYCYYIYQIMHLAKFHKETLKTRYCDGYWEVWLESPSQPTPARPGTIMFNGGTKC